jgi:hypothetical protein
MLDYPIQFMGVNATREHQRLITKLSAGLYWLFMNGSIKLEPIAEVMLDDTATSPTPDVILTDNVLDKDVVLIEIMGKKAFKSDFSKVQKLVDEYELEEGFAYNYQQKVWKKYKRNIGEITEKPSFCDSIGYDLNEFVK